MALDEDVGQEGGRVAQRLVEVEVALHLGEGVAGVAAAGVVEEQGPGGEQEPGGGDIRDGGPAQRDALGQVLQVGDVEGEAGPADRGDGRGGTGGQGRQLGVGDDERRVGGVGVVNGHGPGRRTRCQGEVQQFPKVFPVRGGDEADLDIGARDGGRRPVPADGNDVGLEQQPAGFERGRGEAIGPEESVIRVALKPGPVRVEALKDRLRETLPAHLRQWAAAKWEREGVPADVAAARLAEPRLSFEPADIVNEVMSFGSPSPVEVVVSGPKLADDRASAEKVYAELAKVPAVVDLRYAQALDYPTVEVAADRERLAAAGATAADLARAVTPYTSSSRFTVPNYWRDPASGVGYQVQVEVPFALVQSPRDLELAPVVSAGEGEVLVRDVGQVREGTMPGQVDRYNVRRVVGMTGNVRGADLGAVARQVGAAVAAAGPPPAGVQVDVRGQVAPLNELFRGLGRGLAAAVVVIGLMPLAYFQSAWLALVAVAPVPAVLAGVGGMLLATGTTLNLQSFMGAIMAVGVATANAILLVTFAERARLAGMTAREAGVEGARSRVRAVLMTSAAMIAGMVPMAVGLGEGGDQTAPLGRAVTGGLAAGTLTTLFVLPAVFALVMGRAGTRSASLDPFDPASRHYRPGVSDSDADLYGRMG
ncbi:MAG: efflux RND transporter permease subunit [Gemmataceae bacterium]|nr:efflux RND transporter permease subunit [Gemmataceae bacterium]